MFSLTRVAWSRCLFTAIKTLWHLVLGWEWIPGSILFYAHHSSWWVEETISCCFWYLSPGITEFYASLLPSVCQDVSWYGKQPGRTSSTKCLWRFESVQCWERGMSMQWPYRSHHLGLCPTQILRIFYSDSSSQMPLFQNGSSFFFHLQQSPNRTLLPDLEPNHNQLTRCHWFSI